VNGPEEVKKHVWFKNYNWRELLKKKVKAPYLPSKTNENFDPSLKVKRMSSENSQEDNIRLLKKEDIQNFFSGYYYSCDEHVADGNKIQ